MGHQGDGSALDLLRLLATTDTAPHVRIAAVEAIGRIGGDSALAILSPLIADETDHGLERFIPGLDPGDPISVDSPTAPDQIAVVREFLQGGAS